jgi:hypothetical protein
VIITLAAFSALATGSLPALAEPVKIESSGKPIEVEIGHLAPNFYDWDKDGKLDLLVGTFLNAELRIYKNVGSNNAPRFDGYTLAQAEGKNMKGEAG